MHYVIMNRNSLEAFHRGGLKPLDRLFFVDQHNDKLLWTPYVVDAARFDLENDAWQCIYHFAGFDNGNQNYFVVSVHGKSTAYSTHTKELSEGEFISYIDERGPNGKSSEDLHDRGRAAHVQESGREGGSV